MAGKILKTIRSYTEPDTGDERYQAILNPVKNGSISKRLKVADCKSAS